MSILEPRVVTSATVEKRVNEVTVTWTLGELAPGGASEFMSYGVEVAGDEGSVVRRFAVKMFASARTIAYIFEMPSATQVNYDATTVTITDTRVVARFNDAVLGVQAVSSVAPWLDVDGRDVQSSAPATIVD